MNDDPPGRSISQAGIPWRDIATDALRFWERGRLLYNAVLALVVVGYFLAELPESQNGETLDGLLGLVVLAVLANVCYCAAYVVDVFVQLSGFQELWRRWRWLLLALGIVFAAIIARSFAAGLTRSPMID